VSSYGWKENFSGDKNQVMEIFSHGLWTLALNEAVARRTKSAHMRRYLEFLLFFSVFPDLFSFTPYAVARIFQGSDIFHRLGNSLVPAYMLQSYRISHSLAVWLLVFLAVWVVRKRLLVSLWGWALHILIDIFSHNNSTFATSFLYPFSDISFQTFDWGSSIFMIVNYGLLTVICFWLYHSYRRTKTDHRTLKHSAVMADEIGSE
jgi:hypothetical protein